MSNKDQVIKLAMGILRDNADILSIKALLETAFEAGVIQGRTEAYLEAAKIIKGYVHGK